MKNLTMPCPHAISGMGRCPSSKPINDARLKAVLK
jgi:hypothetical protein